MPRPSPRQGIDEATINLQSPHDLCLVLVLVLGCFSYRVIHRNLCNLYRKIDDEHEHEHNLTSTSTNAIPRTNGNIIAKHALTRLLRL